MSNSADNHESLTFVVRLWRETNTDSQGRWRGRVEHVASQAVGYVEDAAGVASFIEHWTRLEEEVRPMHRSERNSIMMMSVLEKLVKRLIRDR